MFIPTVPFVPNAKVINNKIIYCDKFLLTKNYKNNIIVSSVNNVTEKNLENCLKTILETNQDTIFYNIQYSESEKKVYFYTDIKIHTKNWENKNNNIQNIYNSHNLIEELKSILLSQENTDTNCISIYDLAILIKDKYSEYQNIDITYQKLFNKKIHSAYGTTTNFKLFNFDEEQKLLKTGFNFGNIYENYQITIFSKKDDQLVIKETNCYWNKEIIRIIGKDISKLYDKYIEYCEYKKQNKYNVKSINTNCIVNIDFDGVDISYQNTKDYKLTFHDVVDEYEQDFNLKTATKLLKDMEDELFKKIFIKIENCPKWCQSTLYEIRQNELADKQQKEIERQYEEMQKQKKLEFKKKLFPFIKR